MTRVSWFKKIQLFFTYREEIMKVERILQNDFNARIDGAYRIYTVINVPQEIVEEPYNMRKSDIDIIAENFIKEYSSKLSRFLNSRGLSEFYDYYEITKVDKYSYLVVIGFALFNTQKIFTRFFYIFLPIFSILSVLIGYILLK